MNKKGLLHAGLAVLVPTVAVLLILSCSALAESNSTIEIWYGSTQDFGQIGIPQVWVNILGNVQDPDGIDTLTYSLNGGAPTSLSIGPDLRRLESVGDFNADIAYDDLVAGPNQVVFVATDDLGNTTVETMTVHYYAGNIWPLPYSVNWSSVTEIQDVAQVVDGPWSLGSNSVRTLEPGYDRLIAIGDVSWTDYEVTVPITMHTTDGDGGAGILMRWNGHTDDPIPGTQPKSGFLPLGAIGWYRRYGDGGDAYLEIHGNGNPDIIARDDTRTLVAGVPYMFKMRVETIPGVGGKYSLKVWESGQSEPDQWDLTGQEALTDPQAGSMLLLAHHWDTSFGDVTITPVGDADITLTTHAVGSGSVDVQPNEPVYDYGQIVKLTAQPDPGWTFAGWSGDLDGTTNTGTVAATGDAELASTAGESPVSDDFNSCSLDTNLWTWVDPRANSTYAMTGTFSNDAWLSITVPDTTRHDIWDDGNYAARVMQPISDTDLELEVKFESELSQQFQMQGVLIQQDSDDFLRFEFYSDGVATNLLAAVFEPDSPLSPTIEYDEPITNTGIAPLYMRVRREGNQWNQSYSFDGVDWTTPVTLVHALTATRAGVYAANAGATQPTHTAQIDYFFNTAAPISPEDGDRNTLTVSVDPLDSGTVDTVPAKSSYACNELVSLSASANTGWTFDSWSGDLVTTTNPISVTMTGSRVITAHFTDVDDIPAIDVIKEGPAAASVGDTVVYTFTVTNDDTTGDGSDIDNIMVEDNVVGTATYVSGDAGADGVLEVGETWVYTASYTVQPDDPDPLINTVTASGEDLDDEPVSDTDDHSLDVAFLPTIQVVKEGPAAADVGDTVVYTFTVTNDDTAGDGSVVDGITVDDDVAGTTTYVSGDDGDDLLEVGEAWIYTASYTVQPDDPDPLINTVTAAGEDLEGDSISDTDSHSLGLRYTPAIQVVKEGPAAAEVGDTVVYTFTVTNDDTTGDGSVVDALTVDDDVAGTATYVSGDDGADGMLEVGEAWIYTASYTVQPDDPDPLVNTVTASGQDLDGSTISGTDSHSLDIAFAPAIEVVKDGPTVVQVGDTVIYTFAVTNDDASGDGSAIGSVTVVDDIAGPATYVSGGDGDDLLEVGEAWIYTASYTVQPDDPDPLVNTVTASGLDLDDDQVSDTDNHSAVVGEYFIFLPLVAADA